jgi:hypothetical protein
MTKDVDQGRGNSLVVVLNAFESASEVGGDER